MLENNRSVAAAVAGVLALVGGGACGGDVAPLTIQDESEPSDAEPPRRDAGAGDGPVEVVRPPDAGSADAGAPIRDAGPLPEQCRVPGEPGPCLAAIPRFTYVAERNRCELIIWGGCGDEANLFASIGDCAEVCAPAAPPCADASRSPTIASLLTDACGPPGLQGPECRRETVISARREPCDAVQVAASGPAGDVARRNRGALTPRAQALLRQAALDVQAAFPGDERYEQPGSAAISALTLVDGRGEVVHSYPTPPHELYFADRLMLELTLALLECRTDDPLVSVAFDCDPDPE